MTSPAERGDWPGVFFVLMEVIAHAKQTDAAVQTSGMQSADA